MMAGHIVEHVNGLLIPSGRGQCGPVFVKQTWMWVGVGGVRGCGGGGG